MSTSRGSAHRSDLQDVTECPICCLRFERPLQLSCGHSFCGNCVDRLIADARNAANRNDNFPEPMRGIAAPNIEQGMNPPQFNRMDQEIWWPLNRPQMVAAPPPPPPGLGGIPHPPRYVLRNFNDEAPFFPRRAVAANPPAENVIKCPECRQSTRVPPEGLPINYRLQELLSHVTEVSNQSNDQCDADGSPLPRCLACDDVISKGVYLMCHTCTGETVRQLCSMCCLRNHNGHDIEEKRFLTMHDVTAARDVVSEATGLGYQYVDLAINELTTATESTRDLIQTRAQSLLVEFEAIASGIQFEMLSSNDDLDNKVATAKGISSKLELLPRIIKGLAEEFHNRIAAQVDEFVNNSPSQNDTSCSGTSVTLRLRKLDFEDERRSAARKCALLQRRVRQHRLAQQLGQNLRRRVASRVQEEGIQENYVPDQRAQESERRDRLREERRVSFLMGDERNEVRRLRKLRLHALATEPTNSASRSASQAEEVKRSQSVEIVGEAPPAVVDLEQRAERLIISPQRRRNRNAGNNAAAEQDVYVEQ
ncbi:hypothetical protein COOONC_04502, partial [Cooperia oncophora]